MIAKVKKQSLFLVALYLGYSGYGSGQPDEEASILPVVAEPLPELYEENLPLRAKDQLVKKLPDPFKIAQRFLKTDDELEVQGSTQVESEEEEATVLELQSTMRLMDGPVAFFNNRKYAIGQQLVQISGVDSPVLKSVRGPVVEVEYLGEVYSLDLHAYPQLRLGKTSAKLMATSSDGESGANSADSADDS